MEYYYGLLSIGKVYKLIYIVVVFKDLYNLCWKEVKESEKEIEKERFGLLG